MEASYLVPFTLILFWLIVLLAVVLLQRCLQSQNDHLKQFQQKQGIVMYEEYGEVIYGEREREK